MGIGGFWTGALEGKIGYVERIIDEERCIIKRIDNDQFILMQFTGLLDKNGREIYEGDIVRHRKLYRLARDLEDGIMFGMMGNKPQEVKFEAHGFTPLAGWIDEAIKDMQWEVIGNIYEDKNLLNK